MNRIVLDSSALLAIVYSEPGAAKLIALLQDEDVEPLISAVNQCEIQTRLLRDGVSTDETLKLIAQFQLKIEAFGELDASAAAALYSQTKVFGLSLGDRACLSLAMREKVTAWTADKVWKKLKIDVEVELIRL